MEELTHASFYTDLFDRALGWVLSDGFALLVTVVVCMAAFKLNKFIFRRFADRMSARANGTARDETRKRMVTLSGILRNVVSVVIWVVMAINVLKRIGVDVGPVLVSAGIVGLAVGFGAQELVRDFISGFFILLEDQIRSGDVVEINGVCGTVEGIRLRTVTLRDANGVVHLFPNGRIATLANMTKEWSAIVLDIGVAYKEDVDRVSGVMERVGEEMRAEAALGASMIAPIEILGLDNFADSALVIRARLKTRPGEQWAVGREYRRRLKIAFDAAGIEIPFPHTTLCWHPDNPAVGVTRPEAPAKEGNS